MISVDLFLFTLPFFERVEHGRFDALVKRFGQTCRGGGGTAQLVHDRVVEELAQRFRQVLDPVSDVGAQRGRDLTAFRFFFSFYSPVKFN